MKEIEKEIQGKNEREKKVGFRQRFKKTRRKKRKELFRVSVRVWVGERDIDKERQKERRDKKVIRKKTSGIRIQTNILKLRKKVNR